MSRRIQVKIGEATDTVISPGLFAHNLEHTRSCIHHGLSAQMLDNRKFAGKPMCRTGIAAGWYRIGPKEVYMTLDRMDAYVRHVKDSGQRRNECNSQVIQNPMEGQEAGIGQGGIFLEKGKIYEIRAIVKCRSESPMTWAVRMANHDGTKIYLCHEEQAGQGSWEKIAFCFEAGENDSHARLEIIFSGKGEMKVGAVSMLPKDHFHGMRRDVVERMKELGVSALRWPGGNFAGEYRWKDGLLDVDERGALMSFRAIETHPHTNGFDFHEIGIDDFIALCREIKAQPYITINLAWDSPEESAEFVEYCNGDETMVWGRKRWERGHKEPYDVKLWSLGNEFGLGHMEGPNTPEEYSRKALLCARRMKEADESIILLASGAYSPEHDARLWVEESLPKLAPEIDYISYHYYLPRLFESGMDFVTEEGKRDSWGQIIQAADLCARDLRKLRRDMDRGTDAMRQVKIAFDEWNLYFTWYHDPCVAEGVYTALMLEMFCRTQDEFNMPLAMYFQPINEGAIHVYEKDSELTANGQVFRLMKVHEGNRLVESETGAPALHCLISQHENKRFVTLINTDYDHDLEVCLDHMDPDRVIACTLLKGDELLPGHKFQEASLNVTGEGVAVPKYSIVQLELLTTDF